MYASFIEDKESLGWLMVVAPSVKDSGNTESR